MEMKYKIGKASEITTGITGRHSFFGGTPCAACGILVPQPGTEPTPPEVEASSLIHWTTKELPGIPS